MAKSGLTPSQRIKLRKGITSYLAMDDWSSIKATFSEFGVPELAGFSGGKEPYVLERTKHASDEVLIDLAKHCGFELEAPAIVVLPAFWKPAMLRLFISHLSVERGYAAELKAALARYGISGFVAHDDIQPTKEWESEILAGLRTCHALVALLHEGFHESEWTDQEVGFVMGRGAPVSTITFGEPPYGFIGRFQAFSGKDESPGAVARALFDAYRKHENTQRNMASALVALFESSDTFAQAKERVGYLEKLETWDAEFAPRIQAASESNSQISGSFGVPERVAALIKKWS